VDPKENPSLWNDHVAPLDQRAARRRLGQSVVNSETQSMIDTAVEKEAHKPNTPCITAYKEELHKILGKGNRFIRDMMHATKGVLF
jgi:hypothetical protein